MRNIVWVTLVLVLLSTANAETIDLNEGTDSTVQSYSQLIDQDILDILNGDALTHAIIDGYSSVGIQIDSTRHVVTIEDDKILSIEEDDTTPVDYTLETSLKELLSIYTQKDTLSPIEVLRMLIMDKDVPMKVIFRVVGLIMGVSK